MKKFLRTISWSWLCPALFKYFDAPPKSLYIRAEPEHGRFELTELQALKDRIKELEQLLGKLTLENDLFKRGKQL